MANNPATPLKDDDEEKKEIQQQLETLPKGRLSDEKIAELKALKEKAKKHGLDISNLDALLNENNAGDEINVNELDDHATEEDGEWKDKVREAINEANTKLKNRFEEDKEDTEHLTFKEGENTISFSSPSDAYVEGEQKAFDELVVAAKQMGKTPIKFGKFEKHPEYKAMLYLACLKHGMEMSNAPELSELATINHPQAKKALNEITRTKYKEPYNEFVDARNEFFDALENPKNAEEIELHSLVESLKSAKNDTEKEKIKEQIKITPLGKKLDDAIKQRAQFLQEGLAAGVLTKESLEKNKEKRENRRENKENKDRNKISVDISVIQQALQSQGR